ncbi:putative integral membrane protein [Brugia pahangi]
MTHLISASFVFITIIVVSSRGNPKYQRFFVNTKAINFVDATKHGFRIVLLDSFLDSYLAPIQIPTLFITAIPLKSDESAVIKISYPDNIRNDKQVSISDLRERQWYYICVEWENFNRHNESTGTDCRILRTLDRSGKSAETSVTDVEIIDISSTAMQFRIRSIVEFPIRLTATLHSATMAHPASQTFVFREPTDLDVFFPFLKQDTDYGKLCIIEEPLVTGYTTMGRLIGDMSIEKCYFGKLRTKDYELSTFDAEASAYRRAASSRNFNYSFSTFLFCLLTFHAISITR